MKIVPATATDARALTAIAFAAKRHWGYPESWLRSWAGELTIAPEYISTYPTFVALVGERMVGFVALQLAADEAVLDHLWVLPDAMGRGLGRALFVHAESVARQAGAMQLGLVGDPHAEGFYRRMGATLCGRRSAAMEGVARSLPLFRKPL